MGADSKGNLYVLYELPDWCIKRYVGGLDELKNRMNEWFGTRVKVPVRGPQYNDHILRIANESGINIEGACSDERKEFLDSFITDVYLRADPLLPLEEYLKKMSGSNADYDTLTQERMNKRFAEELLRDPVILGLPLGGTFYQEVALFFQLI